MNGQARDYSVMMEMPAWKDLERYAKEEKDASFRREDSKTATNLSLNEVCEERGIRKGMERLLRYAEEKKEGV